MFLLEDEGETLPLAPLPGDITAMGKADLRTGPAFAVSGKTGAGIAQLIDRDHRHPRHPREGAGLAIRERHRTAILRAIRALEVAQR